MNAAMKITLSKRLIAIILAVLIGISLFNTYLILETKNGYYQSNALNYDYVLSHNGVNYQFKNMVAGFIQKGFTSASSAINSALADGKSIYINAGTYELTEDVVISDKIGARIVSDGAVIIGNGKKIIIRGYDFTTSKYNTISGLTLINATIRIENSFGTAISNMIFENTDIGIEVINTNSWSEYTRIDNSHFINATEGIVFRTPVGNATGSYASSEITDSFFNIIDNSVGIIVEELAEFSDSQITNVRMWMGENGFKRNQTGLVNDGTMQHTLLEGVVFESFADYADDIYGISLGNSSVSSPIIAGGVTFLGNWTSPIYNPYYKWIGGIGSVFDRENLAVPVGLGNQFGQELAVHNDPLKIISFKPKIQVEGSFAAGETVTVRVRLKFIDNTVSKAIVHTFGSADTVWLTDEEIMQLFPSMSIISAVLVDAKTSASATSVSVKVSGYGITG